MESKHFNNLDSWFFTHLRRVLGIMHQIVIRWQAKLFGKKPMLLHFLNADPQEPIHHVALGPAFKNRVAGYEHKAGPPPPHWLVYTLGHAMEYYSHAIGNDQPYLRSTRGLQLYIQTMLPRIPCAAPTRQSSMFLLYRQSMWSAWQP